MTIERYREIRARAKRWTPLHTVESDRDSLLFLVDELALALRPGFGGARLEGAMDIAEAIIGDDR